MWSAKSEKEYLEQRKVLVVERSIWFLEAAKLLVEGVKDELQCS